MRVRKNNDNSITIVDNIQVLYKNRIVDKYRIVITYRRDSDGFFCSKGRSLDKMLNLISGRLQIKKMYLEISYKTQKYENMVLSSIKNVEVLENDYTTHRIRKNRIKNLINCL